MLGPSSLPSCASSPSTVPDPASTRGIGTEPHSPHPPATLHTARQPHAGSLTTAGLLHLQLAKRPRSPDLQYGDDPRQPGPGPYHAAYVTDSPAETVDNRVCAGYGEGSYQATYIRLTGRVTAESPSARYPRENADNGRDGATDDTGETSAGGRE